MLFSLALEENAPVILTVHSDKNDDANNAYVMWMLCDGDGDDDGNDFCHCFLACAVHHPFFIILTIFFLFCVYYCYYYYCYYYHFISSSNENYIFFKELIFPP